MSCLDPYLTSYLDLHKSPKDASSRRHQLGSTVFRLPLEQSPLSPRALTGTQPYMMMYIEQHNRLRIDSTMHTPRRPPHVSHPLPYYDYSSGSTHYDSLARTASLRHNSKQHNEKLQPSSGQDIMSYKSNTITTVKMPPQPTQYSEFLQHYKDKLKKERRRNLRRLGKEEQQRTGGGTWSKTNHNIGSGMSGDIKVEYPLHSTKSEKKKSCSTSQLDSLDPCKWSKPTHPAIVSIIQNSGELTHRKLYPQSTLNPPKMSGTLSRPFRGDARTISQHRGQNLESGRRRLPSLHRMRKARSRKAEVEYELVGWNDQTPDAETEEPVVYG